MSRWNHPVPHAWASMRPHTTIEPAFLSLTNKHILQITSAQVVALVNYIKSYQQELLPYVADFTKRYVKFHNFFYKDILNEPRVPYNIKFYSNLDEALQDINNFHKSLRNSFKLYSYYIIQAWRALTRTQRIDLLKIVDQIRVDFQKNARATIPPFTVLTHFDKMTILHRAVVYHEQIGLNSSQVEQISSISNKWIVKYHDLESKLWRARINLSDSVFSKFWSANNLDPAEMTIESTALNAADAEKDFIYEYLLTINEGLSILTPDQNIKLLEIYQNELKMENSSMQEHIPVLERLLPRYIKKELTEQERLEAVNELTNATNLIQTPQPSSNNIRDCVIHIYNVHHKLTE